MNLRSIGYWGIVGCLLLALNLYSPGEPTGLERLLAGSIILIAAAVNRWGFRSSDIAFMPIFAFGFAIYYAVPIFILVRQATFLSLPMDLMADSINKTLLLCLAGLSLTIIGFYGPWRHAIARIVPTFELDWPDEGAVVVASSLIGVISLVALWVTFRTGLPEAIREPFKVCAETYFLALIALFVLQLKGRLGWMGIALLWGILIPTRVLLGVTQGYFAYGITVGLALCMTYATVRRRIPWGLVILGLVGFLLLQPVKANFRKQVWVNGATNMDQPESEKVEAMIGSFQQGLSAFDALGLETTVSVATERLAQIVTFVWVVVLTPDAVAYWEGESYEPIFWKFVPRAFYPDKPDEVSGGTFGHRYGFVEPFDYTTSINLPQIVEFYINFGIPGVLLGSLLLGVFYRVVHSMFVHPAARFGAVVAVLFIMTKYLAFEINLSLVVAPLHEHLLSVAFMYYAVRFVSALRSESMYRHVHARPAFPEGI